MIAVACRTPHVAFWRPSESGVAAALIAGNGFLEANQEGPFFRILLEVGVTITGVVSLVHLVHGFRLSFQISFCSHPFLRILPAASTACRSILFSPIRPFFRVHSFLSISRNPFDFGAFCLFFFIGCLMSSGYNSASLNKITLMADLSSNQTTIKGRSGQPY